MYKSGPIIENKRKKFPKNISSLWLAKYRLLKLPPLSFDSYPHNYVYLAF